MIKKLNDNNFEKEVLGYNKIYLVIFEKKWSGASEIIKPILKRLELRFKDELKIGSVDIKNNENICARYSIKSAPEFIIFVNGRIAKMIREIVPYKILEELIGEFLHQLSKRKREAE